MFFFYYFYFRKKVYEVYVHGKIAKNKKRRVV